MPALKAISSNRSKSRGSATSLSFVGLMAPHIARMMGFRRTMPHIVISALVGGLLLVFADWCVEIIIVIVGFTGVVVQALVMEVVNMEVRRGGDGVVTGATGSTSSRHSDTPAGPTPPRARTRRTRTCNGLATFDLKSSKQEDNTVEVTLENGVIHQISQFLNIKWSKPCTARNENRFCCFSGSKFIFFILLHRKVRRLSFF